MVRRSDERGMLQYLAEGGGVAGEAADHGRRRWHVPAGDHQAPGHSWGGANILPGLPQNPRASPCTLLPPRE